jgi:hypothetical protein
MPPMPSALKQGPLRLSPKRRELFFEMVSMLNEAEAGRRFRLRVPAEIDTGQAQPDPCSEP